MEPFEPPDWLDREDELLAPYAMHTRASRGRRHAEDEHPYRTLYQRDRDRIVHSTAFRRLMYKTQVLVTQSGDHHRTRLTHTLEVAQISRTIARQLGLNEDLTEAIALAHDLGHPPFGHAGETALDECMREHGTLFEHNRHALRILEVLEYRYADFQGLNLSYEVLEAQAMHSKCKEAAEIKAYLDAGRPLLEAQVVDACDSLAYDTHDVDDALGVGFITFDDLDDVSFWKKTVDEVRRRHANLGQLQFQPTAIRAMIDWQVTDLLAETRQNLRQQRVHSLADVRQAKQPLVEFSADMRGLRTELEAFLHRAVYQHYRVLRMSAKGSRMLREMFAELVRRPELLPPRYARRAREGSVSQTVCDYLAGMTDRYAQEEYQRLFPPYPFV